ncbi:uncharacterized protein LOC143374729 isoform X2 [Andrena cerasifolii]|uniref:uncharacterized protein LOC143374729 isoform X2 n=1 Tax=Andrena cerasifolii TaxID=2819439 RepID=UPI004037B630
MSRQLRGERDHVSRCDLREQRDLRNLRDRRDDRDLRDLRDYRDVRDLRDERDLRDVRDERDLRDVRDERDLRDVRDERDPRDARDVPLERHGPGRHHRNEYLDYDHHPTAASTSALTNNPELPGTRGRF